MWLLVREVISVKLADMTGHTLTHSWDSYDSWKLHTNTRTYTHAYTCTHILRATLIPECSYTGLAYKQYSTLPLFRVAAQNRKSWKSSLFYNILWRRTKKKKPNIFTLCLSSFTEYRTRALRQNGYSIVWLHVVSLEQWISVARFYFIFLTVHFCQHAALL